MMERLQKIMARAGVASRRHAEQLILAGHVMVNDEVITELGSKADPERDRIQVAGKRLRFPERKTYILLNKPARCVTTMSDPEGRRTLRHCLRGVRGRVFPVGRLDYHTEGLLLLTDDGDLANRLSRAAGLSQTYWVKLKGSLSREEIKAVEEKTRGRIRLLKSGPNPWYEVRLTEARRDLLRKTLVRMGHPVEKMKRVRLASLELGSMPPGCYRHLQAEEVAGLVRAAEKAAEIRRNKQGPPSGHGLAR